MTVNHKICHTVIWGVIPLKNIKYLRLMRELTQLSVQMKTGIEQTTLSYYETGARVPTIDNLLILAEFYNTSLDYLMDLTDVQEPYPRKK